MDKVVHHKKEHYDVYIGRHVDTNIGKWGNPYTHHGDILVELVEKYTHTENKFY